MVKQGGQGLRCNELQTLTPGVALATPCKPTPRRSSAMKLAVPLSVADAPQYGVPLDDGLCSTHLTEETPRTPPLLRSILKRPIRTLPEQMQKGIETTCPAISNPGSDPRVQFQTKLCIHEYSRLVGGSCCVPQDGSNLALGLGELVRTVSEPESQKRCKPRNCGEGLTFLPVGQRERLLRACEKAQANLVPRAIWTTHRTELRGVQKSRAAELEVSTNWQPMLGSAKKAHTRAVKLAATLQKTPARRGKGQKSVRHVAVAKPGGAPSAAPVRVVKLATAKRSPQRRKKLSQRDDYEDST